MKLIFRWRRSRNRTGHPRRWVKRIRSLSSGPILDTVDEKSGSLSGARQVCSAPGEGTWADVGWAVLAAGPAGTADGSQVARSVTIAAASEILLSTPTPLTASVAT